jgi:flagellar hook-basal body complex protein FliE
VSQIDVTSLLNQMRRLSSEVERPSGLGEAKPAAPGGGFGDALRSAIGDVSQTQQTADRMMTSFERGDPNTDLAHVMVAVQKADLSFRAMNEVRNKLVDAYKEIMNMSV